MSGEINWSAPIEAVHEDGRVVGAVVEDNAVPPDDMTWGVRRNDRRYMHVENDGTPYSRMNDFKGWRIRNVAKAAETGPTAPSGGEVGPEVVERMIAFLRRLDGWDGSYALASDMTEARAIVALLPKPVDADLVAARRAVSEMKLFQHVAHQILAGAWDELGIIGATRDAIRSTRALEKGEAA